MPATLFPDRASRERSVSVLSDGYQSATESKLDAYARYYGINFRNSASMESDYSNEYTSSSSKRLSRISEVEDRRTTDREFREYSVASAVSGTGAAEYDYSKALVAANAIDARARSKTPFLDLSRDTPVPASFNAAAYSSTGKSDSEALYDVLSYTRNVLSLMGNDGNVKVNLTYRPTPPVYNYSPTHKHVHVFSPNNYYVTQPAPAQPAYQPPAPVYHHHHHYPSRSVTTTTTRKFYLPAGVAAQQLSAVRSTGEVTTEYGNVSSSETSALDYRRSNRAQSEFRETTGATDALDYRRSGRAVSEFRDAGAVYTPYEESKLDVYARAYGIDLRARSQARARSEFLDNFDAGAAGAEFGGPRARSQARGRSEFLENFDAGAAAAEFGGPNRRAKLEAALEEDEETYRHRLEERAERGTSLRP